jgi:hypothetical protein
MADGQAYWWADRFGIEPQATVTNKKLFYLQKQLFVYSVLL